MKNQLITLATISFQQTFQVHSNKHHFPQKKSMAATKEKRKSGDITKCVFDFTAKTYQI
jgi:hypothetical protein